MPYLMCNLYFPVNIQDFAAANGMNHNGSFKTYILPPVSKKAGQYILQTCFFNYLF